MNGCPNLTELNRHKLRCWSPLHIHPARPQYWWAWIAVRTMLHGPFTGRREQTNTGEVVPLALGAHTVGTELRGVTGLRQPGQCSRGLSCCFWHAVPRLFDCCFGPLDTCTECPGRWSRLIFSSLQGFLLLQSQHQARSRAQAAAPQLSGSVKPYGSLRDICWVNTQKKWSSSIYLSES